MCRNFSHRGGAKMFSRAGVEYEPKLTTLVRITTLPRRPVSASCLLSKACRRRVTRRFLTTTMTEVIHPHGLKPICLFNSWEDSLSALEKSAQEYLAACERLFNSPGYPSNLPNQSSYMSVEVISRRAHEAAPRIRSIMGQFTHAQSLVHEQRNCSISLVPLRILPDDILRSIFIYGNEDYFDQFKVYLTNTRFGFSGVRRPPGKDVSFASLVSQVCRHWRSLALSTGVLWRYIDLGHSTPIEKVETWIKRSQGCSLHFFSNGSGNAPFDYARPHFARCTELHSKGSAQDILAALPMFREVKTLQKLSLQLRYIPSHDPVLQDLRATMQRLSGVRRLYLFGVSPPSDSTFLSRLSELTLVYPYHPSSGTSLLDLLSSCEQLVVLKIGYLFQDVPGRAQPFRMPRLRQLSIKHTRLDQVVSVLSHFDAPLLHMLKIHPDKSRVGSVARGPAHIVGELCSILQRSMSRTVKHADFRWHLDPELLHNIFLNLPSVESLTCVLGEHVVALIPDPKTGNILPCPLLRNLTVHECDQRHIPHIKDVIQSRTIPDTIPAVSTIKHLKVTQFTDRSRLGLQDGEWIRQRVIYDGP